MFNTKDVRIQRLIASDPDAPEATNEQLRDAKPLTDAFPELARIMRKDGIRRDVLSDAG